MATSSQTTLSPRFPHVAARAGHYESIYLTASDPVEPVAVWIRYTVHQPPGGVATGAIWFTLFEPGGPTAVKITGDAPSTDEPTVDGARLIVMGEHGAVRRDGAYGEISGHGVSASWKLQFEPTDAELRHLPYPWMYRSPVPRTKSTSPYPSMLVRGTVTLAGRTLSLDGWPGMLGHNWGAEHAHRWIWLRGASFTEHPDAWLDVVIGRIKLGPVLLPWIANGVFAPDGAAGVRHRIGGMGNRATVRERSDGCDLVLPGHGVSVSARVSAPIAASVGWQYADPTGGRHQVRNCSVAGLALSVWHRKRAGGDSRQHLVTPHGGVYELGRIDFDPAVVMQPYSDG